MKRCPECIGDLGTEIGQVLEVVKRADCDNCKGCDCPGCSCGTECTPDCASNQASPEYQRCTECGGRIDTDEFPGWTTCQACQDTY